MDTQTALTVGALAGMAGITVRTLHHYDEIGLLAPATRSDGGYRIYGAGEVERLQEILYFRELGFSLEQIAEIVGAPGYRREAALRRQRGLLQARMERIGRLMAAIDTTLDSKGHRMDLSPEDMLEVFGDFDPTEYEDEARQRWGDTDAYRESTRRVQSYTKDDWLAVQREADEINRAFLDLMDRGVPADDAAAMDLAERHRAHISRWFYECTPEIHAGLGQMYVADPRFTENIDRAGRGLASYLSDAIAANAGRGR